MTPTPPIRPHRPSHRSLRPRRDRRQSGVALPIALALVVAVATLATVLQRRGRDVATATGLEASYLRCQRAADSAEAWARAAWSAPDARPDTTRVTVGGCRVELTPVFDDTPQRGLQRLVLVVRTNDPTGGQREVPRGARSARFERAWRPQAR